MAGKCVQKSIIEKKKEKNWINRSITFQSCKTFVNWFKQLRETSVKYAGNNLYIHLSFCLPINPHVAGCAATWLEAAVYCTSTEPQIEINFLFKSHYMKTGNFRVRHFFQVTPLHTDHLAWTRRGRASLQPAKSPLSIRCDETHAGWRPKRHKTFRREHGRKNNKTAMGSHV